MRNTLYRDLTERAILREGSRENMSTEREAVAQQGSERLALFDIGLNLTSHRFDSDRAEVLERAWERGLWGALITGTSVKESQAARALAQESTALWSTAGIHPHDAAQRPDNWRASISSLARTDEVVAIGECGLDYARDFSPRDVQRRCFEEQVELAIELQLPLFLHEREASEDFLAILRPAVSALPGAVVHCFTGGPERLEEYLSLGCFVGITGWLCDERRGADLREACAQIPAERILFETDAPYLTPRDLRPRPKRGRNEPALLPHILHAAARLRGDDPVALALQSSENVVELFKLTAPQLPRMNDSGTNDSGTNDSGTNDSGTNDSGT